MKYRILRRGNFFYAQYRQFFIWWTFQQVVSPYGSYNKRFETEDLARQEIDEQISFKKNIKKARSNYETIVY